MIPVDGGEWFGKTPMIPREVVPGAQESPNEAILVRSQLSRGVEKQSRSMGPGRSKL